MKIPDIKQNPLAYVLEQGLVKEGTWLEFGVFKGRTINLIASHSKSTVYGFDSFNGLPDEWDIDDSIKISCGHYSYEDFALENNLSSKLPDVADNVQLVKGLFSETLPKFITNQSITLVHIDCDLYKSTKDIFQHISSNIAHGCILVFDELVNYPNYKKHELLAFEEWIAESNADYEFIGMEGSFEESPKKVHDKREQKVALRIIHNPQYLHG